MTTATQKTSSTRLTIGQPQADGSVYFARQKDPKDGVMKNWFTTAEDLKDSRNGSLTLNFNDAAVQVAKLDVHGHNDWQIGHEAIVSEQCNTQNKGKLNGTYTGLKYGSATSHPRNDNLVAAQYFDDAEPISPSKTEKLSFRPVRCEPC